MHTLALSALFDGFLRHFLVLTLLKSSVKIQDAVPVVKQQKPAQHFLFLPEGARAVRQLL